MTAGTPVINRGALKLIAALAVPASIGWFFYYANQQANMEVEQFKKEQKDNPIAERVEIKNYGLKEVDDSNQILWQLIAKTGSVDPNGHDVSLEDVKVEYFDKLTHALKMRLTAPIGQANQQTRAVKLFGKDNIYVVAEGGNQSRFQCKQVELIKKNQFLASGGVIIDWPGVAKVSGNSASGSTDLGAGPKDFKVMGNTHALIMVK
jgi:hypothetical protein